MKSLKIKRALIAVYDKSEVVDFARILSTEFGIEIISTGGTAKALQDGGIAVTLVEDVTGMPELLDGRVKTLHPKIHAGILADRDNPGHMQQLKEHNITPIDMVVVNLYPFEETISKENYEFSEAIEMIDIGGPCMLRAAAKNHAHVLTITNPSSYEYVVGCLRDGDEHQQHELYLSGALAAFDTTASYDGMITSWLAVDPDDGTSYIEYERLWNVGKLRYGENPHQFAQLMQFSSVSPEASLLNIDAEDASVAMSFNNYVDADAALELCKELHAAWPDVANAVFIKHTNPCGVGVDPDPIEAYRRAYLGDPNAAMGGILAVNQPVTVETATVVMDSLARWGREAGAGAFFLEVWIAPEFDNEAMRVIRTSRGWGENIRCLAVGDMGIERDDRQAQFRPIVNGLLAQQRDLIGLDEREWKVVTKRKPTDGEMNDLRLAWLAAKHTKSNAITICRDGQQIGNGAGQMSRIMSCRIATWAARDNGHTEQLTGASAASDAFFPFRDGPEILADSGIAALIQPGGSKRDQETIDACNERGLAMIFTGTRHFRH